MFYKNLNRSELNFKLGLMFFNRWNPTLKIATFFR
jgi:hypothetical protein